MRFVLIVPVVVAVCALAACGGSGGGGGNQNNNFNAAPLTPCPDPVQGPVGTDWPEVFVGEAGCDDAGPGTRPTPFCTFGAAFAAVDAAPGIVTVLQGTYRLTDQYPADAFRFDISRPGTADAYFVVRADDGASPVLLGSVSFPGSGFEAVAGGLYRTAADGLGRDPAGMWTASGTRIDHHHGPFGQSFHVDTSELTEGRWTKADDAGAACGDENTGCYIYLRPPAGMDVAAETFEVAQGGFFSASDSHYMVLRGLTIQFTHWTPTFFSGSDHVLVEDNEFAHNAAQGGNNAYGLSLWSTNASLVRRNRVIDTRYWTEVNAWGVTFMISGEQDDGDIWVCENELSDFTGAAIGSKGGAGRVHALANLISRCGTGVEVPESRCDGPQCNLRYPGGNWVIGENLIVGCNRGVDLAFIDADLQEHVHPNVMHNNVVVDAEFGLSVQQGDPLWTVRNNVFIGMTGAAVRLGGVDDPGDLIPSSLDSNHNFFVDAPAYVLYNAFQVQGFWDLAETQSALGLETNSLSGDPMLDPADGYRPLAGSPVIGAGDSSVYPGTTDPVNMGRFPFP